MRKNALWPALLWTGAIFILSAFPGRFIPQVQDFWSWLGPDKLVHLFLYAGLAIVWLRGLKQYSGNNHRFLIVFAVIAGGTVFGFLMEWLQRHFFTGRNGNVYDAIANTLGLIIGAVLFHIFLRKKGTMT